MTEPVVFAFVTSSEIEVTHAEDNIEETDEE
jgi:hypothetical protein